MKIKRKQMVGKMQFIVVSHFEKTNAVCVKDALSKIMLNIASEKVNSLKMKKPD